MKPKTTEKGTLGEGCCWGCDQRPWKLWTKQSGEINYVVADTGTSARGRSCCPAEETENNSPEAQQRILSAKSTLSSFFWFWLALTRSHQMRPPTLSNTVVVAFILKWYKAVSTVSYPQPPLPHMETLPTPLCAKDPPAFDRDLAEACLLRPFCPTLLTPCGWARNISSVTHKHQQEIFLFIGCHGFQKAFCISFHLTSEKIVHASWVVRWTCPW